MALAKNVAMILAGGLGQRKKDGAELPLQFRPLGRKPIIIRALEAFESCEAVDAICIVCLPSWEGYVQELVVKHGLTKVLYIVPGGDTRQQSVFNGLCALELHFSAEDLVIVHDGVRPFLTAETVRANIATARKYGNAMTCTAIDDALLEAPDGTMARAALNNEHVCQVQTPQSYELAHGLALYRRAYSQGRVSHRDCCSLFLKQGCKVYVSKGEEANIKLSSSERITYMDFLYDMMTTDESAK